MRFPTFLGPLTPLPMPPTVFAAPAGGPLGGGGPAKLLPLVMQTQQHGNWCWAATASSISSFFDPTSTWGQCDVASACLGATCCSAPGPCNVQFTLDAPLTQTGNMQGSPFAGNDSQIGLQSEVDSDRPVCCHIHWAGGGGHFVAIVGYDWGTGDVIVDDSQSGRWTGPYGTFVASYLGSGDWDFTYYTQP